MPLPECPTCGSTDVRTLAAAYAAGTTDFQATSVYIGTKGNRGIAPTFGRTQTVQARLSKPPRRKEWTIIGWFALWFVLVLFVSLWTESSVESDLIFALAVSVVLTFFCSLVQYELAKEYNEQVYPQEMQRWESSFICDRCMSVFEFSSPPRFANAGIYPNIFEQQNEQTILFQASDQLLLSSQMNESEMEVTDLLKAAESGNVDAQFEMGRRCELGINDVVENDLEAAKWYRRAAECGHVEAKACLGSLLWLGEGIDHDPAEALKCTQEAISAGDETAERTLGMMYEFGEGVEKNYVEAARLYRRCAERGDSLAQYNLGSLYERGLGVPENVVDAIVWYSKAEKEVRLAQDALARLRSTARTSK